MKAQEQPPFDADRMTTPQAAQYLDVSEESLKADRCRGQLGIAFYRVGRLVRYRRSDLDAYLERRRQVLTV